MSIFDRLFGSRSGSSGAGAHGNLEERLQALEKRARDAQPGHQGMFLNKAGDQCMGAGERERALAYYGRAIDLLLEEGQPEVARGVANKIIRIHPDAIRTLCTLTWLDLASRHTATALDHLRDYVRAAKEGGQEKLAGEAILEMARVAPDPEFRTAAADALDLLDFGDEAGEIRDETLPEMDPLTDPEELASACVNAARGGRAKPDD